MIRCAWSNIHPVPADSDKETISFDLTNLKYNGPVQFVVFCIPQTYLTIIPTCKKDVLRGVCG